MAVRNFPMGTLRKLLHVIIEICVSYSARMLVVLLDPSAEGI